MLKHWRRTLALLGVVAATGLVCAAVALAKKPAPPPPPPPISYSMTVLGKLGGDVTSCACDVNNSGDVVGWSQSADGTYRAFMYDNTLGVMVPLNDLIDPNSGWDLIRAYGINDSGQIAGWGYVGGQRRAYRFTPGYTDETGVQVPAVIEDLGALGEPSSRAYSINDYGEVAGSLDAGGHTTGAFVYTDADGDGDEEMVDIGDLGGGWARAYAINNDGQVAGESDTDVTRILDQHAFRYTPGEDGLPGVMEDLGILGPPDTFMNESSGNDINDNGHVVGTAYTGDRIKGWATEHAFIYTDHMIDLGTLGGYNSYGNGINSSGAVVGNSHDSNRNQPPDANPCHGFLYTEEFGMLKLESLIVNLLADYQGPISAEKINDSGQICGQADGQAILLTPVTP
jgi:probable HAF family extracellular repeat protein